MTTPFAFSFPKLAATVVGMSAIAAATRVNLEHSASEPTSAIGAAIMVFGLVTIACAIAAPRAWSEGRRILALLIVMAAMAGELFGLSAAVERIAGQRTERHRLTVSTSLAYQIAYDRLTTARHELSEATQKAMEATRGGCGPQCSALRDIEAQARQRVVEAERALRAQTSQGSPLAKFLGLDPLTIEASLAVMFGLSLTLGGAGLVAFGAHSPRSLAQRPGHPVEDSSPIQWHEHRGHPLPGLDDNVGASRTPAGRGPKPGFPTMSLRTGQAKLGETILDVVKASNGRLDASVRDLAAKVGKPKSTVHVALTTLVAAGLLSRTADGAGYVLAA